MAKIINYWNSFVNYLFLQPDSPLYILQQIFLARQLGSHGAGGGGRGGGRGGGEVGTEQRHQLSLTRRHHLVKFLVVRASLRTWKPWVYLRKGFCYCWQDHIYLMIKKKTREDCRYISISGKLLTAPWTMGNIFLGSTPMLVNFLWHLAIVLGGSVVVRPNTQANSALNPKYSRHE